MVVEKERNRGGGTQQRVGVFRWYRIFVCYNVFVKVCQCLYDDKNITERFTRINVYTYVLYIYVCVYVCSSGLASNHINYQVIHYCYYLQ